jgi:NAD(P)-dependent dehydrogenase (short-subunit alcohol dehydrogenase family)
MDLSGKVAVITGGSRGLGFAIAMELARSGASVVIGSRNASSVAQAVDMIRRQGYSAAGLPGDVSNQNYHQSLSAFALKEFGHLDIWINNAGAAGPYGPTLEVPVADYLNVLSTNINGVYFGSLAAMDIFTKQHNGKLINILGRGWNGPVAYQNAYAPTKVWIKNFTLALADEYKTSGVGVFSINPGMILTDLLTRVQVITGHEEKLKVFPMVIRILANTADVPAKKVVWIASDATNGKTRKVYQVTNTGHMLKNGLKVLFSKLIRKPLSTIGLQMESIPGRLSE